VANGKRLNNPLFGVPTPDLETWGCHSRAATTPTDLRQVVRWSSISGLAWKWTGLRSVGESTKLQIIAASARLDIQLQALFPGRGRRWTPRPIGRRIVAAGEQLTGYSVAAWLLPLKARTHESDRPAGR